MTNHRPPVYTFRVEVVDPGGRLRTVGREMDAAEFEAPEVNGRELLRRVVDLLVDELIADWRRT